MQDIFDRPVKDNAENAQKATNALHNEALIDLSSRSTNSASDNQATSRASAAAASTPEAYSVIPAILLKQIANKSGNLDLLKEAKQAQAMESRDREFHPNPRTGGSDNGAREVYDAQGQPNLPGDLVRTEGSRASGNAEADKVYEFTGIVRDFYKTVFNRDSIDDNGMKMVSTVDYRQNPDKAYNNAFWNGEQMIYGKPDASSPFKSFMFLDVTGHEITHGVTENESNEKYYGQSGALNESISDVFGELIKQYAAHQTADQADWLVGAGIWKDGIDGRALRDMLHPGTAYDDDKIGKDPQPADMAHYVKLFGPEGDHGGVHINSGIPNRAFALFAKAVGGFAWDDPGHIWYEARKHAGNNPSFAQFAFATIEAAKSLGHGDEVAKLQKAWSTVGVVPSATAVDTETPRGPVDDDGDQLRKAGQLANQGDKKNAA